MSAMKYNFKNNNLVYDNLTDNSNNNNNNNSNNSSTNQSAVSPTIVPSSSNNNTPTKRSSKYYTYRNSRELNKEIEKYGFNSQNVYTNISAGMVPNSKSNHADNNIIHNGYNYYQTNHLNLFAHPNNGQLLQSNLIDTNRIVKSLAAPAHRNSKIATVTPASLCPLYITRPTTAVPMENHTPVANTVAKQDNLVGAGPAIDKRYSMNIMGCNSPSCKQHQQLVIPGKTNKDNALTFAYFSNTNYTLGRKSSNKKEDRASVIANGNHQISETNNNKCCVCPNQTNSIKESIKQDNSSSNQNNNEQETKISAKLNVTKTQAPKLNDTNINENNNNHKSTEVSVSKNKLKPSLDKNDVKQKSTEKPNSLNTNKSENTNNVISHTTTTATTNNNNNKNIDNSNNINNINTTNNKLFGAATTRPKHFSMYIESTNTYNSANKPSTKNLLKNISLIDGICPKPVSQKQQSDQNFQNNITAKSIKADDLCYNEAQINSFNKKLLNLDRFETVKLNTKLIIDEIKTQVSNEKKAIDKNNLENNKNHQQSELMSSPISTNTPKTVKFINDKENNNVKSNNSPIGYDESKPKSNSKAIENGKDSKPESINSPKSNCTIKSSENKKPITGLTKTTVNNNQIGRDLDNLEKLTYLLKEQASHTKQTNRIIDIEKANQLYMKYFTTNGKLIKQNHFVEPVKKKIEIELSKNLDAKLVKTDQNTKIVITTATINSDEKTEEIEKIAYFSTPSDDDESDLSSTKINEEEKEKKVPSETAKKDKLLKLADINKIEITNDNFNQMNANNNKEIEQVFNNYINSNSKSDSDDKNNKPKKLSQKSNNNDTTNNNNNINENNNENLKIKRNGYVFDDNIDYSEIQANNNNNHNKQEEKLAQTPIGTISQKTSSNLIALADKRKTPVTMLRKIATPPPLPHILDKLRYLNVNELIHKRSSKCSEQIVSPCSQSKTSQATISSDLNSTSGCKSSSASDQSSSKQTVDVNENRQICSNDKSNALTNARRKSCHTPAPTMNLNQEITVDTNNNNIQKKQFNETNNNSQNMACDMIKKTDPSLSTQNSNLVIKVKEDSTVDQIQTTSNNNNNENTTNNKINNETKSSKVENSSNSKPAVALAAKTPIPITLRETSEKQNCKKSLNRKSNPLADNSHYSIRNKFEGLSEMDRLREEKRPKSAYPFKEPVKLKPTNIAHSPHYLVAPFDNLATLKTASQFNNYYATNNNNNIINSRFNPHPYHYHYHNNLHIQPNINSYYNEEKFFDNFLNQITNGKDSKNDKSFYKYYAKENDRRKREGNSFLMLLPGIAIPIDTDAGESEDESNSSTSN